MNECWTLGKGHFTRRGWVALIGLVIAGIAEAAVSTLPIWTYDGSDASTALGGST